MLAHCHWHDRPQEHPTLILLHGLEGSSLAHYMGGMADKAWARGWNVVRLNQRNCGDTEHLSRGLYHSGLTNDPLFVLRELIERDGIRALAVAGYSLGGNLTLKLAGDLGDAAPPQLKAVCAVSPTMDLAVCVKALERKANVAYQWNFVRQLKARMRRKAAVVPGVFTLEPLRRIWTVRQFDEAYTAPHHGFRDAADYYYRASAMRVIDRIARAGTHPHRRGRSVRAGRTVSRSGGDGQSARDDDRHAARRALCVRRACSRRIRRLLGRGAGGPVRHVTRSCSISIRANSGPFPSSSCLKYTKTSRHADVRSVIVCAQRAMSSAT